MRPPSLRAAGLSHIAIRSIDRWRSASGARAARSPTPGARRRCATAATRPASRCDRTAGTLIVLDCGTGAHAARPRAAVARREPSRGHLLIAHTHWDHIQGLPFFAPLFVPGNEWDIYAPRGVGESLRETLAGQMQYTYFPVSARAARAPRSATTISSRASSRSATSRDDALPEPSGADARLPARGRRRHRGLRDRSRAATVAHWPRVTRRHSRGRGPAARGVPRRRRPRHPRRAVHGERVPGEGRLGTPPVEYAVTMAAAAGSGAWPCSTTIRSAATRTSTRSSTGPDASRRPSARRSMSSLRPRDRRSR